MGSRKSDTNNRTIATNRKARRLYEIDETFEAGLALLGSEVKSLRAGMLSVGDAYVDDLGGSELFLVNLHIKPYPHANRNNHEPLRARKLLLKHAEIERIRQRINERGYTAVPLVFRLRNGWIKVELGLGRGKKLHDRRQDIKQRDAKREIDRSLRRG